MLFKGVLIGLELREFDNVRHVFGIPALTKSRFGKNQSYEVLTPDRRYITLINLDVGLQSHPRA